MSDLRAALIELADDFDSNVDWSAGRSNYGDNEAWESAARQLRAVLADQAQREAGAMSANCTCAETNATGATTPDFLCESCGE